MAESLARKGQARLRAKPFIKWAGGKSQLLGELLARVPERFASYHEPFLGGAALYFALQPETAYLSDINSELISLYGVVQGQVEELISRLSSYSYDEDDFYKVRALDREDSFGRISSLDRAARFIFLNKTCYNGLYRVNSKGQFNVPFGRYKDPKICDGDNLRACSVTLESAHLHQSDFLKASKQARKGDFVYFDPPYAPLSATSSFTSYDKDEFGAEQQRQLHEVCCELDNRGVKFMLSNSSAPLITDLYKNFRLDLVDATRAINSKAKGRGKIKEVIVRNY